MTVDALLQEVKKLAPADRIRFAEEVWDSVAADAPSAATLSPAQLAELDRRLDRVERDGLKGTSWDELKRELIGEVRP
jgi:putative addiction module component (TIGR02574 family)